MVSYEWVVESVTAAETPDHEANEIIDVHHFDSYREAVALANAPADDGCKWEVALVRDHDGDRAWAYIADGVLPPIFRDAYGNECSRVPRRYIAEVARL